MLDTKAIAEATAAVVKAHVAALIEPLRASVAALERRIDALPVPQNGKDADEEAIAARVRDDVAAELKRLRALVEAIPPAPELPDIAGMVEQAVSDAREQDVAQVQSWMDGVDEKFAALPVPRDGKDAEPEFIKQLVDEAVAALPPAPAGKDADPVTAEQIADAVARHLDANPPAAGKDGVDGRDGKDGEPGAKGEDGKDGASGRDGVDGKDGADGKDGVSLAAGVIDREHNLILTLSNGEQKNLGRVVGRDGAPGKDGAAGRDGFSLKDFDAELMNDGRTVLLKFEDGTDISFAVELGFPTMIYRGVWREGVYQKGDTVTFGGSLWHSNKDENAEKPDGTSDAWTLAAKRGQNGRDGKGAA